MTSSKRKVGRPPKRAADGRTLEELVIAETLADPMRTTDDVWAIVEPQIEGGTTREYVAKVQFWCRRWGTLPPAPRPGVRRPNRKRKFFIHAERNLGKLLRELTLD